MATNMDMSTRLFQASLCQSRSLVDNLEPATARLVADLQKQIDKLKGDIEIERNRCRSMARDHLVELKRLREEQEYRLEASLEAQGQRKQSEKIMELKKLEETLRREKEVAIRSLTREKGDELRAMEKKLAAEYEEKLRYAVEQERRQAFNEAQAQLPDEGELIARETKLAKEVFSLGGENMKLEDQVRHLSVENKSQIDMIRRMKKEHEAEIDSLLRKNKSEAARDSARLRLGEQIIQEREAEYMEMCQRAEAAENESAELQKELLVLRAMTDSTGDKVKKDNSPQTARRSGSLLKQVEELEYSVRKLEDDKSVLKQENASLRKRLSQEAEGKGLKETDDKMKRLRKRNADLVTLTKTLEERCKVLKMENTKMQEKQVLNNSDIEQQIRKTLSRQHAKDISDYTRKIASRDREIVELKRKLSKYEVTGGVARSEHSSETAKKMKTISLEKLKAEKLIAKLYSELQTHRDQLKEKDEEIASLKDRVQLLKSEVSKSEELVLELQGAVDLLSQAPDTNNTYIQTSPLFSPQRYQKSSQTSPASVRVTTIIEENTPSNQQESSPSNQQGSAPGNQQENVPSNTAPSNQQVVYDLHSELAEVGVSVSDSYDSQMDTSNENLTNQISSDSTTQDNSLFEVGVVNSDKVTPTFDVSSEAVSLYIVCDDYHPLTMSPNPDSERELSLRKGDYVYVDGSIDEVGFYTGYNPQGRKGLIPSNYVKKLTNDNFKSSAVVHSQVPFTLPPPLNLEMVQQSVQDDSYSVTIKWDHPKLLPLASYRVYVNSQLRTTVSNNSNSTVSNNSNSTVSNNSNSTVSNNGNTTAVSLTNVPRHEFVYISVRTCMNDLESPDPQKMIEINPQLPEVPIQLKVQLVSPLLYRLSWKLCRFPAPTLNYELFINESVLLKKVSSESLVLDDDGEYFMSLGPEDVQSMDTSAPYTMSLRVTDGPTVSPYSASLPLPSELILLIKEHQETTSSSTSEVVGAYNEVGVASSSITSNSESSLPEIIQVSVGSLYRALYSYDPSVSSPNGEGAGDELTFYENNIIKALGELDEDGFFLGSCNGAEGLVPKNMVQLITHETDGSSDYDHSVSNGNYSVHLVKALYDYEPKTQSPNEEYQEELSFTSGDYITVYGEPVDGFYEGELNGLKGYVPKSFVEPVSNSFLLKSLSGSSLQNQTEQTDNIES
ncbi:PREDICTED: peripheral-type benzodiazepine receptor-associated protein 1-like isoform X2 [Amphimedon queenslandica]|uniref:SH3 domain-containing protein n=1 Tax=Amphimedon queenslandica TaxID=400682 RepID=A0AAN0IWA2_AMPQE|nr:PREDICTED: peripheral-type benzodiazepine receptor-associated protein 1-like isoform X2 [Amphimedon queenslandica]|eukprot:XP_019848716.1 PREDICTED: peripheral-type benzodiazepine receptor-associated protein 1-like isoform X2 [Amphimedon queenslandica]